MWCDRDVSNINVSNHYVVDLNLTQCYMSIISKQKSSATFWTPIGRLREESVSRLIRAVGSSQFLVVAELRQPSAARCPELQQVPLLSLYMGSCISETATVCWTLLVLWSPLPSSSLFSIGEHSLRMKFMRLDWAHPSNPGWSFLFKTCDLNCNCKSLLLCTVTYS